jgi:hypothetical protein
MQMTTTTRIVNTLLILSLAIFAGTAAGQESADQHPQLRSTWWVDLGGFYPDRKFTLSAHGNVSNNNGEYQFDQQLGLKERDPIFEGQIGWQFGDKWDVAAQYFSSSKDSRRMLSDDVEWEDVVYEVGADIRAGTELSVTRIVFSRDFYETGPHSLRLAAGLHLLELSAFISGQARIDNMTSAFRKSENSVSAPLPNIGAWYNYSPNKKWLFSLRADWLEASIDNVSGSITNVYGGINYSILDNVGIGIGYQRFGLDVTLREPNWRGTADLEFSGPTFAISGYW